MQCADIVRNLLTVFIIYRAESDASVSITKDSHPIGSSKLVATPSPTFFMTANPPMTSPELLIRYP